MSDYSQTFIIEKNVPLPSAKSQGGTSKYPFGEMQVGDSFFFGGPATRIRSACSISARRHNRRYSVRVEGSGFRVWRTA